MASSITVDEANSDLTYSGHVTLNYDHDRQEDKLKGGWLMVGAVTFQDVNQDQVIDEDAAGPDVVWSWLVRPDGDSGSVTLYFPGSPENPQSSTWTGGAAKGAAHLYIYKFGGSNGETIRTIASCEFDVSG